MRSETASVHSGDLSFWALIVQLGGGKGHLLIENLIDSSKHVREFVDKILNQKLLDATVCA